MTAKTEPDVKGMNLYQKLAAITGEVGIIAKDGNNTEQHFKFIEYAAVAGRLRDLFAKYGVVIVPSMPPLAQQNRTTVTSKFGKEGTYLLLDMKFDVINADKPDERFDVSWTAEAIDYGDKATNKAATGALKYYLMRQFNISEKGEDPDTESPEHIPTQQPASRPPAPVLTTKQLLNHISDLLERKGITEDDYKRTVILGIADVAEPSLLTANKLKAVIRVLRQESVEHIRELYLEDDRPDEQLPAAVPTDDIDQDIMDLYSEQKSDASEPDASGTLVYSVPTFPGNEDGKIIPPAMTKQINDWIEKLGWTDVETVTFMHGVIGMEKPKLRRDAQKVLEYLADELNEREAANRQEAA